MHTFSSPEISGGMLVLGINVRPVGDRLFGAPEKSGCTEK
jgi:hypothetical protein